MGGQRRQDEEREGKPDQTPAVRAEIKVGKSFRVLKCIKTEIKASVKTFLGTDFTSDTHRLQNITCAELQIHQPVRVLVHRRALWSFSGTIKHQKLN